VRNVIETPLTRDRSGFTDTFEVLVGSGTEQRRFTLHHETIA
jgi:hypothetical protein